MHHGPTNPWSKSNDPSLRRNQGDSQQRIKDLEREVRDLKEANAILKAASIFFARELCATRRQVYREAVRGLDPG